MIMDLKDIIFCIPKVKKNPTVSLTTQKEFILNASFSELANVKSGEYFRIGINDGCVYLVRTDADKSNGFEVKKYNDCHRIRVASFYAKHYSELKQKQVFNVEVVSDEVFKLTPYSP